MGTRLQVRALGQEGQEDRCRTLALGAQPGPGGESGAMKDGCCPRRAGEVLR